jgi:hypothetical protein
VPGDRLAVTKTRNCGAQTRTPSHCTVRWQLIYDSAYFHDYLFAFACVCEVGGCMCHAGAAAIAEVEGAFKAEPVGKLASRNGDAAANYPPTNSSRLRTQPTTKAMAIQFVHSVSVR